MSEKRNEIHELAFMLDADTGILCVDTSVPGTSSLFAKAGLKFSGQHGYRSYRGNVKDLNPDRLYALMAAIKLCREFHENLSSPKTPQFLRKLKPLKKRSPKQAPWSTRARVAA